MATSPTRLKNPQAIQHLKDKALLPAFSYADVLAYEHAIAFSVAKMMNADMLADTQHALVQALENGTPFSEFKKTLKPYLMAKGWWGEQMVIDPKDGQEKKSSWVAIDGLKSFMKPTYLPPMPKGVGKKSKATNGYCLICNICRPSPKHAVMSINPIMG